MTNEEILSAFESAESPEEMLAIARENGWDKFDEESARAYYELYHASKGELSDDEMEAAVGGAKLKGRRTVTVWTKCVDFCCTNEEANKL